MSAGEKACSRCGVVKSLDSFHKHRLKPDGHQYHCKDCTRVYGALSIGKSLFHRADTKKACSTCGEIKKRSSFHKNKRCQDGYVGQCKACTNPGRRINSRKIRMTEEGRVSLLLADVKARARRKGLPFNLTRNDLKHPDHCPVLNIPLERGDGYARDNSPSLDRLIPSLGYISSNVRVISYRANTIKNNATLEELKAIVAWMEKDDT